MVMTRGKAWMLMGLPNPQTKILPLGHPVHPLPFGGAQEALRGRASSFSKRTCPILEE